MMTSISTVMGKAKTRRKKIPSLLRGVIAKNANARARVLWPASKNLPQSIRDASGVADAEKLILSHVKRILKSEAGLSVEQIDMLAAALDLAPYQLLLPDLDPLNPQLVKGATAAEQALYKQIAQEAVAEALARSDGRVRHVHKTK